MKDTTNKEQKGIPWEDIINLMEAEIIKLEGEFFSPSGVEYMFEFFYNDKIDKWTLLFE